MKEGIASLAIDTSIPANMSLAEIESELEKLTPDEHELLRQKNPCLSVFIRGQTVSWSFAHRSAARAISVN